MLRRASFVISKHNRNQHFQAYTQNQTEAQRSTRKGHAASVRRQSRQRLRSGFGLEAKNNPVRLRSLAARRGFVPKGVV